jgi:hypothetical protein
MPYRADVETMATEPGTRAGARATALTGEAIGAGVGAIAGARLGLGIREEEARYYEEEVRSGRTLVAGHADGRYADARSVRRRYGAYDIQTREAGGLTYEGAPAGSSLSTTDPMARPEMSPEHGAYASAQPPGVTAGVGERWEDALPRYRSRWERYEQVCLRRRGGAAARVPAPQLGRGRAGAAARLGTARPGAALAPGGRCRAGAWPDMRGGARR